MIPTTSSRSNTPKLNASAESSTVRPRNKRLVSVDQELGSTSQTSSPSGSRAVSPLPARHPSRQNSTTRDGGQGRGARPDEVGRSGAGSSGLGGWEWNGTWASGRLNAFQEVAFGMLGGGVGEGSSGGEARSVTRLQPPLKKDGWFRSRKTPSIWGPETGLPLPQKKDQGVGMGSTETRDAELRAKRRARVLEGRDEGVNTVDTNGNYKARTSTEEYRPGSNHTDDHALVYLHQVQPNDTIQGVVLKYHCQMDVFKKANRFWAGDSIQVRKTVYLPVDACAIKGRPCESPSPNSPQGIDLLAPTPSLEESPFPNGATWGLPLNGTSAEHPDDENPYVHVRWVLLDSSPNSKPVEIVRIPRKTLNYFPPRRRKSLTTLSIVSTPRASIELPSSASSTPSRTSNLGPRLHQLSSSAIGSYFPPPPITIPARSRRESVGETADRLGWLRGPGGVGTLGKSVRKPGPGKDILNTWTKKHIPGITIEDSSMHSTAVFGSESAHLGFSASTDGLGRIAEGSSAPGGSGSAGLGFPSLNISGTPAAVESWMRKIAIKAAAPGTPRPEPVLIEMLDGAGSDDGRGFELDPGVSRTGTPLGGTGRENVDGLVRVRGKSGKSD